MRTSLLVILLAVALAVVLLTPDTVQGWRRRRRRGRRWIRIRGRKLVKNIETGIKVYKALNGRKKRELSDPLTEEALTTVAQGLVASCPESLDSALVMLAVQFDSMDADNDDKLTGKELTNFSNFLGTYNACQ